MKYSVPDCCWHKGTSKPEGKDFANASDYLETWDDSDSITAVNAQKRLETFTKMVA